MRKPFVLQAACAYDEPDIQLIHPAHRWAARASLVCVCPWPCECSHGQGHAPTPGPKTIVGRTWIHRTTAFAAVALPLLGLLLTASNRPAWASVFQMLIAEDGDGRAAPSPPTTQDSGPPGEVAIPTSEGGAAGRDWPVGCVFPTVVKTATITLRETGVTAPCILVSAGDLVTWGNPTAAPIVIQTAGGQFSTEDVSAVFSTVEIPAQGQTTVRVIHAGRIEYAAPDHPGISGTILVLGRGAA
jgi:hypothetical protein